MTEQLDLFAMAAADERDQTERAHGVPSLYARRYDTISGYTDAFARWQRDWGHFASYPHSHAWHPCLTLSADDLEATDTCQASLLLADLRCTHYDTCFCVGDLLYRGFCRGCGWHSPPARDENIAVLATLDHAHPGWRDDPIVPSVPHDPGPHRGATTGGSRPSPNCTRDPDPPAGPSSPAVARTDTGPSPVGPPGEATTSPRNPSTADPRSQPTPPDERRPHNGTTQHTPQRQHTDRAPRERRRRDGHHRRPRRQRQ